MKERLNVIEINGVKGIIFLAGVAVCLIAGFVAFPGIVMKLGWNCLASATGMLPTIGFVQGLLLWGITVVSYFAFRRNGFFVKIKSGRELSPNELNEVMRKIHEERRHDLVTRAIMRAKEFEAQSQTKLDKFEHSEVKLNDGAESVENTEEKSADKFLS